MRRCRQLRLLQRMRKTRESLLCISEYVHLEVTETELLVPAPRPRSECWLVTDSGSAELRMSLLFHTTGHVDPAGDAVAESRLPGSFSSTSYASQIRKIVGKHQRWRAEECLNLIPSENVTSHTVRQLLTGDMGHRYTAWDGFYKGTRFIDELEGLGEKLASEVFGSDWASLRPLSGHIADMIMVSTLTKPGG